MRPCPCLLAALFAVATPAPLFAQAPDVRAATDDMFKRAREAMSRGDYKHALRLLRDSHAADPGRGKLLNIAICEEELGLVATALRHFEEVLPQFVGDPRETTVRTMVREHMAKLDPRVPHLRIQLTSEAPAGTTVTLDGAPVDASSLGTDLLVDPGNHVVKAVAPGVAERTYAVVVTEGAQSMVAVEPERVDAMPPGSSLAPPLPQVGLQPVPAAPTAETSAGRGTGWKLGLAAISVGGVSAVVGAATGIVALNDHAMLEHNCTSGAPCDPAAQASLHAHMMTLAHVSTTTLVAGAALVPTGVILMVASPSGKGSPAAWVSPVIGPVFAGVEGRF